MASYGCDLGFDWSAVQESNNQGPLQACLMDKNNTDQPAWWTDFQENDTVFFTLYDIAPLNGGTAVPDPSFAFQMIIADTELNTQEQALGNANYSWPNANIGSKGTQLSAAYKTTDGLPCWAVGPETDQWGYVYTFTQAGKFNLYLQITVTANGTTNTYVYDPEMVVGPAT